LCEINNNESDEDGGGNDGLEMVNGGGIWSLLLWRRNILPPFQKE